MVYTMSIYYVMEIGDGNAEESQFHHKAGTLYRGRLEPDVNNADRQLIIRERVHYTLNDFCCVMNVFS